MLNRFFVLLFCASFFNGQAQIPTWFEDTFDRPNKQWFFSDIDNDEMTRSIGAGKFSMHHKTRSQIYWTYVSVFVDPVKAFQVESNLTVTENPGSAIGFLILGRDEKAYYFLINTANQTYYVGYFLNGVWRTLNAPNGTDAWGKSTAVRATGTANNLKLFKGDGRVRFLVNNVELFNYNISPEFDDMVTVHYIGFASNNAMRAEIDNFIFRQDNPAVNLVPNLPRLRKVSLGENVNSRYTEKMPYIAPDGKTLFYVVQGDPANSGEWKTDDIYYSVALNDSTWGPRQNAGFPLNNGWPNCVLTATPDNNTLYLMHTYKADGSPNEIGFSMTSRTEAGWSVPSDIKVDGYYNRGPYNEFCFSPDRKVLVMGVKRDDTHGQNDLYVSFLKADGSYTAPRNLGSTINTFAQEASPFLAADGITLYFSTAGLPGFGSSDIFMTRRLDSTWVNWSRPQNLGSDINTIGWDAYYSAPASGRYAYLVSREEGMEGSTDLFRVKLPESLRPKPVVLVYGKVLNSKTRQPIQSNIQYSILSTNVEAGLASSAPVDGSYKIVLPAGDQYGFVANKEGFYAVSDNIDLSKLTSYQEIERNLYLAPLEVGQSIRLNNLFFDFNKSDLRKESFGEIERVVRLLNENPKMSIELAGHTDNVGDDAFNSKLSQERARAVETFLEGKGIATERITSKGYGETRPIASNATEEGRQYNRRVEFLILTL